MTLDPDPLHIEEDAPETMTISEQLRRANLHGPTYWLLTGKITEAEYARFLQEERVRYRVIPRRVSLRRRTLRAIERLARR